MADLAYLLWSLEFCIRILHDVFEKEIGGDEQVNAGTNFDLSTG